MRAPLQIVCPDCGGACGLLGGADDAELEHGDVVAYRCADCLDRWDVVLDDEDDAGE